MQQNYLDVVSVDTLENITLGDPRIRIAGGREGGRERSFVFKIL
jgi:hypothetical protein